MFVPAVAEMYPDGFATTVMVGGLGEVLEGAERGAGHFAGVCTVVCKLFTIVAPDVAFFGQKDAQQVVVVRRMTRDLNLPVRIETVPTVREPDGLAMSSRNARLGPADRERATALHAGLEAARAALQGRRVRPARGRGSPASRRCAPRASSPSTSPSSTPTRSSRCNPAAPSGYLWSWPPASGRPG